MKKLRISKFVIDLYCKEDEMKTMLKDSNKHDLIAYIRYYWQE